MPAVTRTEPGFLRNTRTSYDALAEAYHATFRDELAAKPLDRALLTAFAELVRGEGGPLADVGCGTGRVTAYLSELGVDVFGVDLSPGMLAVARRSYPGLRFEEGSMLALDLPDGGLGGVLAWYSTIHVPDGQLPGVFEEFFRVLAPGGHLLLGFQVGEGARHRTEGFGHGIDLHFRRRHPEPVAGLLTAAGLTVKARLVREKEEGGDFPELTPQAFLLAEKPAAGAGGEDGTTG
ncbi:class I SAM-dependent methyltransferase [Streptomyces sp. NPDC005899]|uniref:class I SAM-dependent DNA methyltransferase n=1 Tax=Streptomyces sp. NPDC005899 TaxID=3155716 RepID=UPI0034089D77